MRLTQEELAYVRSKALHVTEECDACGEALNQSFRYTIAGSPEVYCSAECRDRVFFGDAYRRRTPRQHEAAKREYCGGTIEARRADSLFCSDRCRKANSRRTGKTPKSVRSADSALLPSTP
jgi:hypothetical protein